MKSKLNKTLIIALSIVAIGCTNTVFASTIKKSISAKIDSTTKQVTYSTDEGKTWSKEAPKDLQKPTKDTNKVNYVYKANKDGSFNVLEESNEKGTGLVVKVNSETNEILYSEDHGKTWSKEAPKQFIDQKPKVSNESSYKINSDGSVEDVTGKESGSGVIAKVDSNTKEVMYSKDGGNTWYK